MRGSSVKKQYFGGTGFGMLKSKVRILHDKSNWWGRACCFTILLRPIDLNCHSHTVRECCCCGITYGRWCTTCPTTSMVETTPTVHANHVSHRDSRTKYFTSSGSSLRLQIQLYAICDNFDDCVEKGNNYWIKLLSGLKILTKEIFIKHLIIVIFSTAFTKLLSVWISKKS